MEPDRPARFLALGPILTDSNKLAGEILSEREAKSCLQDLGYFDSWRQDASERRGTADSFLAEAKPGGILELDEGWYLLRLGSAW